MNAKESQKKINSVYILRKETGSEDMALYRNIQMSFWTDPKVEDDYTSDDRYFYLFLIYSKNILMTSEESPPTEIESGMAQGHNGYGTEA